MTARSSRQTESRDRGKLCAPVASGTNFSATQQSPLCTRVHALICGAPAREKHQRPFHPTPAMHKSRHGTLWNRLEAKEPYHHLGWSWARRCSRLPWSGWRCPSGTCWWWSSRSQTVSCPRPSASHSGLPGCPRWCVLFCGALPHKYSQLLCLHFIFFSWLQWFFFIFNICILWKRKRRKQMLGEKGKNRNKEKWHLSKSPVHP